VRVCNGPAPTELLSPVVPGEEDDGVAAAAASAVKSSQPPPKASSGIPHQVTSREAIASAVAKSDRLDYSKWDRLDLSDDDAEDCHPNIDMESWKRLKVRITQE
jgi:hypothetical protein